MDTLLRRSVFVIAMLLCVAGLPQAAIHVASDGDDFGGDGTPGSPYRTITTALDNLGVETEIQVGAGMYDTLAGETFPLAVPAGVSVIGVMGPNEDDTDSTVVDADETDMVFVLAVTPDDGTTGLLQNLVIAGASVTAIDMSTWIGTIDNCVFTNVVNDQDSRAVILYSSGGVSRLTLTNTTVRDIALSNAQSKLIDLQGEGSAIIDDCVFKNIDLRRIQSKNGALRFENHSLTLTDTLFDTISWTYSGGWGIEESGFVNNIWREFVMDRCEFRNITGGCGVVCNNRGPGVVRNTLFSNVDVGEWGVIRPFYTTISIYNCTFDNCSSVFRADWGLQLAALPVHNTSVSNCTSLNVGPNRDELQLHTVNIFNTGIDKGYHWDLSDGITSYDPKYKDAAGGDFHLAANSLLIDAGDDAHVTWVDPDDIDQETRIMDGNYDGTAAVDIGYDEFNPVPAVPTFTMPPYYHVFEGESDNIPVSITPAAGASVTADVGLPTGLTGATTLTIADGTGPENLAVTVSAGAGSYEGTTLDVDITHSAGPAVEPGQCNVVAYSKEVAITGDAKLFVVSGSIVELPVTFVSDVLEYPSDVTVTTGAPAGAGSNTIAWVDGNAIAAGDSTTLGHLSVTGGAGVNTVQLTVDQGFVFNESAAASFTLEVAAISSPIHVTADGDDTTGYGTAGAPFRTITKALTLTHLIQEIAVGPGTYDAAAGEVFLLDVPPGVSITGTMGSNEDASDSTVIDPGGAAEALRLRNAEPDVNGLLKNVVITGFLGGAINASGWRGQIDNCVVTGGVAGGTEAVFIYSRDANVDITIANTVVRDITNTSAQQIVLFYDGTGPVNIENCEFSNLEIGQFSFRRGAFRFENPDVNSQCFTLAILDTLFDDIRGIPNDPWESGMINPYNTVSFLMDRCIVRNIDMNVNIVGLNRCAGNAQVRSSLFYNINAGSYSAVAGFRTSHMIYNCTFDSCSSATNSNNGGMINRLYNCSISNCGAVNNNPDATVRLYSVNVFNTPVDNYDLDNSGTVTRVDPMYVDAATGDYHLKTYSPMVDAGNNDYVTWTDPTDLDETERIQDGDGVGDAVVDLGACESNYYNRAESAFLAEFPVYHLFAGSNVDVPVSISPAAAGSVSASVAYGTNLSGSATLTIADGAGPVNLNVAAAATLSAPSGSMSVVTITETTAQGVATGEVGVYLYDNRVTIGVPERLFVSAGSGKLIKVSLLSDLVGAPDTLPITVGAVGGSGTNGITWAGGTTIPEGATESEGDLSVLGGAGENTISLTIGGGFLFDETGTDTVTLTIVGYSSPLYVSGSGSNTTGDGTLANPLRTITYAASLLNPGEEVRVLSGTYSALDGEVLPIEPGGVRIVGAVGEPESCVIDGEFADSHLFKYLNLGEDAGYLGQLTLTNCGDSAVLADNSQVTMQNCLFTDISTPIDAWGAVAWGAALTLKNDATVNANFCVFTELSGTAAVMISSADANWGNNFVANGCEFSENNSDWGTLASTASVDGRWFLTDCVFENNTVPESAYRHDSYCGSAVFISGGSWDATSTLQADRCKFIGGQGGSVLALGYTGEATVRNSLFLDNNSYAAIFHAYRWGLDVVNCTLVNNTGHMTGREPHFGVNVMNSIIDSQGALSGDGQAAQLTLTNTIVWNTPPGDGYNEAASANVLEVDPLFADADNGDYQLKKLSPAVDAGDNSFVVGDTPLDLDLLPRIVDGDGNTELQVPPEGGDPVETAESVDLGCFEFQQLGLPGDVNGDCVVNILDLIGIRNHLNQDPTSPPENLPYNVNGDGSINILDMIYVRNRLNTKCEE